MFPTWFARFRDRYQLGRGWTLADLQAARATHPVRIEDFTVSPESPNPIPTYLESLAVQEQGQPFLKWWQYFDAYDRELGGLAAASREGRVAQPVRLLEIGVWRGGSLGLWRRYFGEQAVIFGLDIDPKSATFGSTDGEIRIGSQVDSEFMRAVIEEMGGVDVIIDDGSHLSAHVVHTLRELWPLLSEGGIYIVEDLHTSYWPSWGGGLRRPGSSMEALKSLADVLHQPYFSAPADSGGLGISRDSLFSVTFFDSMAVLHKGRRPKPQPFRGGVDN